MGSDGLLVWSLDEAESFNSSSSLATLWDQVRGFTEDICSCLSFAGGLGGIFSEGMRTKVKG